MDGEDGSYGVEQLARPEAVEARPEAETAEAAEAHPEALVSHPQAAVGTLDEAEQVEEQALAQ